MRRRLLASTPAVLLSAAGRGTAGASADALTLYTSGDSILDCARYNHVGVCNHRPVYAVIAGLACRYGALADAHAHFLTGDPSCFTRTIEPAGASEGRRVFLGALEQLRF